MGSTDDIKRGAVLRHNGKFYIISNFSFVNPGKGQAFFKCKLRAIGGDKGIEITYKSGETIDSVRVDHETFQYLYNKGELYSFMNNSTYETVEVSEDIIGDDIKYLKEGLDVIASLHEGNVVAIQLAKKVKYKVIDSPPAVKGDTASGSVTKEIGLDNGLHIHAPIFIKEGEEILVNTETGDYGGRVQD